MLGVHSSVARIRDGLSIYKVTIRITAIDLIMIIYRNVGIKATFRYIITTRTILREI